MTRALQAQFKAHWSKILIAIAVASVTIITKTGDAVATRIEQMIFEKSVTNANIVESLSTCKERDSIIMMMHTADVETLSEAIQAMRSSSEELSKKIDYQTAKLEGLIDGIRFRNSLGYTLQAGKDTTAPCAIVY